MLLYDASNLARKLIREHCGNTVGFSFNKRRGALGIWKRRNGISEIQLSRYFVEINEESAVRNTILHEIAHELDFRKRGKTNHDYHWRSIALSIGCDGERCNAFDQRPKSVKEEADKAIADASGVMWISPADLQYGDKIEIRGSVYYFEKWFRVKASVINESGMKFKFRPGSSKIKLIERTGKLPVSSMPKVSISVETPKLKDNEKMPRQLAYGDIFLINGKALKFKHWNRTRFVAEDKHGIEYNVKAANRPLTVLEGWH